MSQAATPLFDLVPLDRQENLEFRLWLREKAVDDPDLQEELREMCRADVLFFMSVFCWIFEPRPAPKVLPFVPWPHQPNLVRTIEGALGKEDVACEKSRGEGLTWIVCLIVLRRWLFDDLFSAGIVSKDEDSADKKDDPDSVMWKIDFALDMLPEWLKPKGFNPGEHRNAGNHSLLNPERRGTIVAYSATSNTGRGGRKTVWIMDELAFFKKNADYDVMASTQHTTYSRICISTPNGDRGMFADMMLGREKKRFVRLRVHWTENPTRNRGLYRSTDGKLEILDNSYVFPPDYPFVLDGKLRSPWYDHECQRPGSTPKKIAQELDLDYAGSVDILFGHEIITRLVARDARSPVGRYMVSADPETLELRLVESPAGSLLLWQPLGFDKRLRFGRYVVASDIGFGRGATGSNSVSHIFDAELREQVGELATSYVATKEFAILTMAIAKWAWQAYMIWESYGPVGGIFTQAVRDYGYEPVYMREVDLVGEEKRTERKAGLAMMTDDDKYLLLESAVDAMEKGNFILRSEAAIREFFEFGWDNGKIIHRASQRSDSQADKGKSHADRAIAAAVGYHALSKQPIVREFDAESYLYLNPPRDSVAWRMRERERKERALAEENWRD